MTDRQTDRQSHSENLCINLSTISRETKIAFFSAIICGFAAHMYKIANYLPGNDSLLYHYSSQNVLGSGRWLLSIACGFSSYYDTPWLIGIFAILLIAIGTCIIVRIFEMQNPVQICLTGGLMATFPAVTYTFFYGYTVDGYMIAMVMAVLAVYYSRLDDNSLLHAIFSATLVCMSCGIYQAYVSFAMVLTLCYFVWQLCENRFSFAEYRRWIVKQFLIYAIGLTAYYMIWKLCMYFQSVQPSSYQGIDQVGTVSVALLKEGIIRSIKSFVFFFFEWNVLEHGWSMYSALNGLFLVSLAVVLIIAVLKSGAYKDYRLLLVILTMGMVVFAAFIWYFTSSGVAYRPIMLYSMSAVYILLGILTARWIKEKYRDLIWCLLFTIVCNYIVQANISYNVMHDCYETTYADSVLMASCISEKNAQSTEKIAILGERIYDVEMLDNPDYPQGMRTMFQGLQENLLFDRWRTYYFLKQIYRYEFIEATENELRELQSRSDIQLMPCWPDKDSIQVVDGILVIKLSE